MLNPIQKGDLSDRTHQRKKKSTERRSKKRRQQLQGGGNFLPAVRNDQHDYQFLNYERNNQPQQQDTFKAIRLTKHDLLINEQPLVNNSPQDSLQNTRSQNSKKKIFGSRTNSLDNGEVLFAKHAIHSSKGQFSQKDGFSIASKSNSVAQQPKVPQLNPSHPSQPSAAQVDNNSSGLGMHPRNTSTNLPQTSKVFIQQHHSSHRGSAETKDSKRQRIQLSSHRDDQENKDRAAGASPGENQNGSVPDHISFDQESHNDEEQPQQLQSMFDSAVNHISASGQMMVTHDGVNFPMLSKNKQSHDLSNTQQSLQGGQNGTTKPTKHHDMLTTKNSLFSKQSHSVVTQEDQHVQDLKTVESRQLVRDLFKPKVLDAQNPLVEKDKRRIHFRRTLDPKPASIFLRRTSSALSTKYSRKFLSNLQVRAALSKPTRDMMYNASFSMPVRDLQTQRYNNDSIYTIGEEGQDSGQIVGFKKTSISSGSGGSASRSNSNQQRSQTRPSYQEPTVVAHNRKPSKDVHRTHMTKALEQMRLAQLKQSRLNRQNVNRVCEDLMQIDKVQNDKELEQFGRNYLKKLYSLDREFATTGNPRNNRFKNEQNFNMTMQSFSIGSQHPSMIASQSPSMDSNYRGRVGLKGMSVQPQISIATALRSGNMSSGNATPFKTAQLAENTTVLQNQRLQPRDAMFISQTHPSQQQQLQAQGKLTDEDYLMQGLLQEHLDPSQGQIVVTLDGELGQSFFQYLASDEAKALYLGEDGQVGKDDANILEDGILGISKPIMPNQSPRNKLLRNALQVDKRAQLAAKKMVSKLFTAPPSFLPDQTTSSPPETAQDYESLQTTVRQDLRMMLSSRQSSCEPPNQEPYRQMMTAETNQHHVFTLSPQKPLQDQLQQQQQANKSFEEQSIVSQETNKTNKVDKSRLNTGNLTTYGGVATLQSDFDRAETQQEPQRKVKRSPKKITHGVHHIQLRKQDYMTRMFEKQYVERAMDQQVELFQSFGAEGQKPPYKLDFDDGRTQTGRPPTDREKYDAGSALRESFERKVVPLNVRGHNDVVTGSINTSRDGGDTPQIDLASSVGRSHVMDLQTVGQGTILFANEDERKFAPQTQLSSAHIIHSPSIVTKDRRTIMKEKRNPSPPIDITMTNYAIDKEYLEKQGSPIAHAGSKLRASHSPPDTKSPQHRGQGTKVLLQQAQMDPNSFLHTQPIHFDNYHVQARPLAKTIYGKQYKQAQEKLHQAKLKIALIEDKKAQAAKQSQLTQILNQSSQQDTLLPMTEMLEIDTAPLFESPQELALTTKEQMGSGGVTVRSMLDTGKKSALGVQNAKYQVVDIQMGSEAGSSMIQNKNYNEQESRITINLNDKDFCKTIGQEDLVRGGAGKRLGSSGTLQHTTHQEFMRHSQMSDKETVMRLPQVVKTAEPKDRVAQPSTIVTEVQHKNSPRKKKETVSPLKLRTSPATRKVKKAQKMTVVQNVQMEELLLNGLTIKETAMPTQVPLQTERIFAKFKGKSPIGSNKPNFLNRKKQESKKNAFSNQTPPHYDNMRVMTETSSNMEDASNLSPAQNKALKVFPLRQKRGQASSPSTQGVTSELTVAFAHNGQLIGRANYNLLAKVTKPTLLKDATKPNSTDITAALQVAQNFDHSSNNATSYVMISSPQIRPGQKEAEVSGSFIQHPQNYTANLQKEDKSLAKCSPTPISGDSYNVRHLVKDHLTAKRLGVEGANTRITHRRVDDDLMPSPKLSQPMAKPGFVSAELDEQKEERQHTATLENEKNDSQGMGNQRLNDPSNATSTNKQSRDESSSI